MKGAARRRRLVLALLIANALVSMREERAPGPGVRRQREAAMRAALAAGRTTYTFETRWTPPVIR